MINGEGVSQEKFLMELVKKIKEKASFIHDLIKNDEYGEAQDFINSNFERFIDMINNFIGDLGRAYDLFHPHDFNQIRLMFIEVLEFILLKIFNGDDNQYQNFLGHLNPIPPEKDDNNKPPPHINTKLSSNPIHEIEDDLKPDTVENSETSQNSIPSQKIDMSQIDLTAPTGMGLQNNKITMNDISLSKLPVPEVPAIPNKHSKSGRIIKQNNSSIYQSLEKDEDAELAATIAADDYRQKHIAQIRKDYNAQFKDEEESGLKKWPKEEREKIIKGAIERYNKRWFEGYYGNELIIPHEYLDNVRPEPEKKEKAFFKEEEDESSGVELIPEVQAIEMGDFNDPIRVLEDAEQQAKEDEINVEEEKHEPNDKETLEAEKEAKRVDGWSFEDSMDLIMQPNDFDLMIGALPPEVPLVYDEEGRIIVASSSDDEKENKVDELADPGVVPDIINDNEIVPDEEYEEEEEEEEKKTE
jgi:hypothetical protein